MVNLLENPGFETGSLIPWTGINAAVVYVNAISSYVAELNSQGSLISQTLVVKPNTKYKATFSVRARSSLPTKIYISCGGDTRNWDIIQWEWHTLSFQFTTVGIPPQLFLIKTENLIAIDNVVLEEEAPPPAFKWKCVSPGSCQLDPQGTYDTQAQCLAACPGPIGCNAPSFQVTLTEV